MSDNVIKFRKPTPVKPPRQIPPRLRRILIIAGVIVAFGLVYTYFSLA